MKDHWLYILMRTLGRGIGQIMFQKNALSGALMLVAIAYASWQVAALALYGALMGTMTALWADYSYDDVDDGLYGFNGALVGIAGGVFLLPTWHTVTLVTIGAAVSTWIARGFRFQSVLKGYTMPFVLATWFVIEGSQFVVPEIHVYPLATDAILIPAYAQAFFLGIGQVMFQGTWVAGALFLIAIAIQSRLDVLYAILASSLCLLAVFVHADDFSAFNLGLFAYNAVLCAIALGDRSLRGLVAALAAILLSVVLQLVGMRFAITTLTAPFVLATWAVELVLNGLDHKKRLASVNALGSQVG